MPIRNEAAFLERCLHSILGQDYPVEQYEILVVDGMSTDQTREIVRGFQNQRANIYLVDNPGLIVPTGMNAALRLARGEVVIRIDGHCTIASNYVQNCVDHLVNEKVDGVGGPMETIGTTRLSETIAAAMSSRFGVGNSSFRTVTGKTMLVDSVPFPAYTREIINRVGFYDEELVRDQDDEYNYRIRAAGGKILLADDVRSKYYSRGSLGKLWRQYFQYGYYKVRVLQKHPRQMSLRQFVPPIFIATLFILAVLSVFFYWGRASLAAIAISYLLSNLLASLMTSGRKGWHHLALLPITFSILHFSYGLGFLAGLYKFRKRWREKGGMIPVPEKSS